MKFLLKIRRILLVLPFLLMAQVALAQSDDAALAREYFRKGEYEKAEALFEKLANNPQQLGAVYPDYLQTLLNLRKFKDAEKLVKKVMKRFPDQPAYDVDLGMVYLKAGNEQNGLKQFDRVLEKINSPNKTTLTAAAFEQNQQWEYAEKAYLKGRNLGRKESDFAAQLIRLYATQKQTDKLLNEVLNLVRVDMSQLSYAQAMLQNSLNDEKQFAALEQVLLNNIQKYPDQVAFNDLLMWVYIQRKDFAGALMQARALDRRARTGGAKVVEIGNISLKNKDYESAIEAFSYLVKEYPDGPFYIFARQRLINAREEQVRNTFPVDLAKIRTLISDYEAMLAELGRTPQTAEVIRNMAMLHALYLDDRSKAIDLLNEVVRMPRVEQDLAAQAKLSLGDIYLLQEEPWESTLLYAQVEKSHADTPLGHEAKLRNAKLNYYKGDFELAQEHLDILKLATSREIANDAMSLSLLITDNTGLDTSTAAMQDYAAAELLVFQHKYTEAIALLDNMLRKYPGHSLTDEVFFQKAEIFLKTGDFQSAVINLSSITDNPQYDILSDDAMFLLAKIYEENLNQPEKAKELYNNLLVKHPGSIYVAEARKRFRKLRGDNLSN